MRNKFFKRTLTAAAVAAAMGVSGLAVAQDTSGSVRGQVTVESGAAQSASVTIRNIETGYTRTIQANSEGTYRFPSLPIGRYVVTANADGYEPVESDIVTVSPGTSRNVAIPLSSGIERIDVSGASISMVDTRSSGTSLNIGEAAIDRIPVPRDATSVALLAPGTVAGSPGFGNLASFGGSSVAENQTYINGLNVTNFRNGLGFSDVPFEFYSDFQVLTGGYSAEFGRSTGGVINAVTKSGTNEFKAGANIYYKPSGLREESPNSFRPDGRALRFNGADSFSEVEANIYASGPIIEDTLFYYAIYSPRDLDEDFTNTSGTTFFNDSADDAFWGGKIDWQINSDHLVELLAFSDSQDTTRLAYPYSQESGIAEGAAPGTTIFERGGDNYSIKYTGYLTQDLTVSALYGENKFALTTSSPQGAVCNIITDQRADAPLGTTAGCATSTLEFGEDTREAARIDFEYVLGFDHLIRFGYDQETNTSTSIQSSPGPNGATYVLKDVNPGGELPNSSAVPAGVDQIAEERVRTVGGDFETVASAYYIEDIWSITPDLTATIGLRNESFENKNSLGQTFVEIKDMWAPRLGLSWDINGDGQSKAFVNIGRYHLPVANNTNVRLSGDENDRTRFYALEGATVGNIDSFESLILDLGEQIGNEVVNADGEVPDVQGIVDQDIDAMYQDELIVGYEAAFADNWSWGVRGIRRELNGAIDDMSIENAIENKFGCEGYFEEAWFGSGAPTYVLGNPGEPMTVKTDTNCDFVADEVVTFSPEELEYPSAVRNYNAVELTLGRAWDGKWSFNASYTWSKSYGNTEGLVKSDIEQDDAGITQDFDFPELMDGAFGDTPNDRRHSFKAYGTYALMDNFLVGANARLTSGRPLNAFGIGHPNGVPVYGDTFYLCSANCDDADLANEYLKFPRGTFSRTDWTFQLDLNATYTTQLANTEVELRFDVYNLLDSQAVTNRYEFAETGTPGNADNAFMLPTTYQTPRYVQLSAGIKF